MTISDAKAFGQRALNRVLGLPLLVILGSAVAALAVILLVAIGLSGPPYRALFQGLTPAQGGAIITRLQKLGIPYRLRRAGTIIEVPVPDVGLARLQLAASGQPDTSTASAWKALEKTSMTASQPAVDALRLQALEQSLEQTIQGVSAASTVRVMVAIPRETPFLATQPRPKASVLITGAAQPDGALGVAVAKIVAGAVPGLVPTDVVVVTGQGRILYPISNNLDPNRALAIQSQIEATEEGKIRSLLTPLFGASQFRVAVSAGVQFAQKTIRSIVYGPKSYPIAADTEESKRVGRRNLAIGIPGALSNQPPGPTTAPVTAPIPPLARAAKAASTSLPGKATSQPVSLSTKGHTQYDVDVTQMRSRPAGWEVGALAVSVVVNKQAMVATTAAEVRKLIAATTTLPVETINVVSAPFVTSRTLVAAANRPLLPALLRATLFVAAALALLFGFFVPSMRWLSRAKISAHSVPERLPREQVDTATGERRDLDQAIERIRQTAQAEPAAVARILQKWLDQIPT